MRLLRVRQMRLILDIFVISIYWRDSSRVEKRDSAKLAFLIRFRVKCVHIVFLFSKFWCANWDVWGFVFQHQKRTHSTRPKLDMQVAAATVHFKKVKVKTPTFYEPQGDSRFPKVNPSNNPQNPKPYNKRFTNPN